MMTRCEYCRQLGDGLECRKCGAPLPDFGGASSVAFSRMMQNDVERATEPGVLVDRMVMVTPEGRVDINRVIALARDKQISTAQAREMLGIKDSEVRIVRDEALLDYGQRNKIDNMTQLFFDEHTLCPSWISRSLVNWRLRD